MLAAAVRKSAEACHRLRKCCVEQRSRNSIIRCLARRAAEEARPAAAIPPRPPQKPFEIGMHGTTWNDPYHWMSHAHDENAVRHMEAHLRKEQRYTEALMADTLKLQSTLQSEMASRMVNLICSSPIRWGPWLYYKRIPEGKQYPLLCRRLASANEEFNWNKRAASGFDFKTGRNLEHLLLDYNEVAQQFGGFACEDICEVSPDHRFIAYTMYDTDKGVFTLCVKDLKTGSLLQNPKIDSVSSLAWAKDGRHLIYTVKNSENRPYRVFSSALESKEPDKMIMEDLDESCSLVVRNTKDFAFITINSSSDTSSKVHVLSSANIEADVNKVWESEPKVRSVLEHHHGHFFMFTDAPMNGKHVDAYYLLFSSVVGCNPDNWKCVFADDPTMKLEDVEFFDKHMVLILRNARRPTALSIDMPLPLDQISSMHLNDANPCLLPAPDHVSNISAGPNHDFNSTTVRLVLSSPLMPKALVDYNLIGKEWVIVEQEDVIGEKLKALYGRSYRLSQTNLNTDTSNTVHKFKSESNDTNNLWNDLSKYYVCEQQEVLSKDCTYVPMTILYSRKMKRNGENPALLYGHGAYGEHLDKVWRGDLKCLLDRDWVIAFADVRGGGAGGKRWHHDGRGLKKQNSIDDFVACANFLISRGYVQHSKLAACGYSAGGLLVAATMNMCPELFRAVILKVPFLDALTTLLDPILPLGDSDYDEFGKPEIPNEFENIRSYSPYENIQKGVLYPAVLITSSLNARFGIWESAKWIARVREYTVNDPLRPVLLYYTLSVVEENLFLICQEAALELAFLIKMLGTSGDSTDDYL